jgi:hypothetical protein
VACSSTTHNPGGTAQGGSASNSDAGASEGGTSAGTSSSGGSKASGGSDSSTGGDVGLPGDPTTAKGFCAGYYAIVAELFGKCWGLSAEQQQTLFSEPQLCDDFLAGVDQHHIGFDGSQGTACLRELKAALTCDGADETSAPSCATVIQPLVQEGQACSPQLDNALGHECAGDTFCQTETTYACTGVCTPRSSVGEPCDPLKGDLRCATDTICDSTTKKCVAEPPPAKLNEACGSAPLGRCASGLYCDLPDGATEGTCAAKKTSGACSSLTECIRTKTCAGPADAKTCVDPKPIGASCTPGNVECNILGRCGKDQKCVDAEGHDGDPCGKQPDGEPAYCARGLYCDGVVLGTGVCHPTKASGASCTGTSIGECGGELGHCDSTTKTCASCQ